MSENKKTAKKIIILYVLKMLQEVSSENQPLTQIAMCKTLNHIGVNCDRKTISRNIKYLKEFGYDIRNVNRRGVYLHNENKLTEIDIKDIIDSLKKSDLDLKRQVELVLKIDKIK